ncbi:MAG: sensor histidine kinase [Bacillota bacterium]|nr:sensor histidine kinase [Bacillota bacterium]
MQGSALNKSLLSSKKKHNLLFRRFKKMSFKFKLLFSFIFVSIIPILVVQSISYYNTTKTMKANVDELIRLSLVQTKKNLDTKLASYTDILRQIYMDDEIIDLVNEINQESGNAIKTSLLRDKLSKLANSKDGIRSIAILCKSGKTIFYDTLTASSIESSWMNSKNFSRNSYYADVAKSKGAFILPASFAIQLGNKKYYLFHIANTIVDFNNMEKGTVGIVVISIDEDILFKAINDEDSVKLENSGVESVNFIVDNNGFVVSFPKKNCIGTDLTKYNLVKSPRINNKYSGLIKELSNYSSSSVITNELQDEKTGWIIVNAVNQSYLFSKVHMAQNLTIIFGVVALLFSIIIIVYLTRNFSISIDKILRAMKTAQEGELSVQVELDEGDEDELSKVAARFNKMIFKINKLLEEVKNATFKQKEAEIRALEAQINPHFLYNTLDAINWMAIEKEEHEISNMLKTLAQILRYSINKSNTIVSMREEIEWLKQYLYLQQTRFNYSFECYMNVDEKVMDSSVHKLLFQPFIENVIIHGFEGLKKGGIIKIEARDMGECIQILIKDNGKGMKEELVEALNTLDDKPIETNGSGLGISNALTRIKMYYEEKGAWKITSSPGQGTSIYLQIPKL